MNATPPFTLHLFGAPRITDSAGVSISGRASQRHRLALLALLGAGQQRRWTREKLMAYLWPERDTEHARQLLNQAVYHLRRTLGENALISAGDELSLNPALVRCDVIELEQALERGNAEAAASLHAAPFLDGFFISDAPEFERWTATERDRLAALYARALEALATAAEAARDLRGAAEWWKRRAAHDPLDSTAALRLMQVLARSGNTAAALQHARIHAQLLEEEFGADPDPEVQALAERLRRAPAPVSILAAAPAPVERTVQRQEEERPAGTETAGASPRTPVPGEPGVSAAPSPSAMAAVPALRTRSWSRQPFRYAVAGVLLAALVFGASRLRPHPVAVPAELGIAVLPLTSLSVDPRDAVFADAMTEALIAMLSQAGSLRVVSSTSVFALRDRRTDVRSIADSLRVPLVVEGGIQKDGDRLRVQVRLVNARDGTLRWSQTYDRTMSDVFAMQDEIARAVAGAVGVRLGARVAGTAAGSQTRSVAAYELYLRGSDRTLLRSDSASRDGIEYFRQAIALDSSYAAAWAGLARLTARVAPRDAPDLSRRAQVELAEQIARRAVALDSALAEAHATLGAILLTQGRVTAAEHHLLTALELDPGQALLHEWLSGLYIWTERPEQALAHARRALELEPLSPTAHAEVARALLFNDRCEEALAQLDPLAALQPPLLRAAPIAAQCLLRLGRARDAIALLERHSSPTNAQTTAQLAFAHARAGEVTQARRALAALELKHRRGMVNAFDIALVHAGLGEVDRAFEWLERATDDVSPLTFGSPFPQAIMGPLFEDLRRDARFQRIRERVLH